MNLLRKCLGRARLLTSGRHQSGDKHEHINKSVDCDSDSEHEKSHNNLRDPCNGYKAKMLNFIRELAIGTLVYMAYAAITNDAPKISKAPAAYPFFNEGSLVQDFYRGQITAATEYSRTSDISFVMYYAPWDAASQAARKEFLFAADYLKDQVVFIAVNCWQPGGECRNQYSKIYRWPVFIVYTSYGFGIQYNGPISAPHMISFLQKLMAPVKKINDTNLRFEEAFIVAELNAFPGSVEFSTYYTTALRYLEADYTARISFYVKPVKYSQDKISLYLWNQVRVLNIGPGDWNVQKILQWIIKSSESPSIWISPTGSKSLLMLDNLQPGPALILFTPKNPFRLASDYYMMLQEIAQEYKNCDNWGLSFDMKKKRLDNLIEHRWLKKSCYQKSASQRMEKISSVTTAPLFANSSSTNYHNIRRRVELGCSALESNIYNDIKMEDCFDPGSQLPIESKSGITYRKSLGRSEFYTTSMLQQESDPRSMPNIRSTLRNEKCKTFLAAEKIHPAVFDFSDSSSNTGFEVAGLSCSNSNASLNIIAIDSIMYYMFAERLGIDLTKRKDRTAAVIINDKMETHYIMREPVTARNLRQFIRAYSNNSLTRSSRSSVNIHSKISPSYPVKSNDSASKPMIFVEELNSKTFLPSVLQEKKTVLVFYYSKQCSYCNGISYVFLTVARKLSFVDSIQFTRIDGDVNILPWEYTMEEFPTILFFPANRKEETRVFPSEMPITVPNLLGFILSNVDSSTKLHVIYSLCLHSQFPKEKHSCLANVRTETISLIERTLKDWRNSSNLQRQLVLHNLKQLRQLQFLFAHSPDDFLAIKNNIKKLKVYLTNSCSRNLPKLMAKDEL